MMRKNPPKSVVKESRIFVTYPFRLCFFLFFACHPPKNNLLYATKYLDETIIIVE
jgi:hypothetical protein